MKKIWQYVFVIGLLSLSCQKEQSLPKVSITTDATLNFEDKNDGKFCYKNGKFKKCLEVKLKYRGGFSRQFEKRSITVDFQNEVSLFGLPAGKDWVLNANYIDKTFIRHKISYDLFNLMDSTNRAAKSVYVQLAFNKKHQGIYIMMQQINEQTLGLNLADTQAVLFKAPPIFYRQRLDSAQTVANYYEQKYPDVEFDDRINEIEAVKRFLFESTDEVFADSIEFWFDIRNVIDWHILLLLTNNGDGIMKNFYLYKVDSTTPYRFAIWDYDHSFCRDGDNEYNNLEAELNWRKSILLKRLADLDDTNYLSQLKARWLELRQSQLISEKQLYKMMAEYRVLLENDLSKNFEIWPVESQWYYDANTFEQEFDLMKTCIAKRIKQMDEYIANLNSESTP
jgi:hypothetical protein